MNLINLETMMIKYILLGIMAFTATEGIEAKTSKRYKHVSKERICKRIKKQSVEIHDLQVDIDRLEERILNLEKLAYIMYMEAHSGSNS